MAEEVGEKRFIRVGSGMSNSADTRRVDDVLLYS
jgi:hypothetical protein